MSKNITFIGTDDDDDKTIFQTEEDRRKIEQEISGLTDDDTTEVEITNQLSAPSKPYWQQVFG